jgi:hypothetical protein
MDIGRIGLARPCIEFREIVLGEVWRLSSGGTRTGLQNPTPTSRAQPVLYLQTGAMFALAALRRVGRTSRLAHQLRQLGDVGGDAPRFVTGHEIGRRSPARLVLVVHIDCCTALGCVAGRGATTATGCRRPDKHIDTPQYRCYLPRRDSRDVLQCTHCPEPWWLRIDRGVRRRVRIGRRCRQHHAVHPPLFGIPPGQRTVQLTEGLAAVVLLIVSARNP